MKRSAVTYANRVSQGMKAKKYKGGVAMKAKTSANKLFDTFCKPLVTS